MVGQFRGLATRFRDRSVAGRELGAALTGKIRSTSVYVLALPRGGLPVAHAVAAALGAPLDVLLVRKLGTPARPELAAGAIASGGVTVYNTEVLNYLGLTEADLDGIREREQAELERRERIYRGDRPFPSLEGKTVILVDDGMATGATMRAAVDSVRSAKPADIIVAVPSASVEAVTLLQRHADEVIALSTPDPYVAVSASYDDFPQVVDAEVVELLSAAWSSDGDATSNRGA
jgi:predicted phosphoribosyltransferase